MARRRRATVRILGAARLRQRLETLPDEIVEALKKAVRESAEAVRDDTRDTVRVHSGNLRDTVDIRYEHNGLTALVGWFEDPEYYARFLEHGTRRAPARPALRPALEAERTRYRARLTAEVRQVLR
ncbi:HK97-gp10 family putative phage morphogenesis protein [Streptomyces sp. NPDC006798]|uniref:HK97-gp10 family putative phage morphogenesis protein n=1 Tax=Streptomyces sp. NPDC006798 TaxID=3155462 RepID=UPI0033D54CD6